MELEKLGAYVDDDAVLDKLLAVKMGNKVRLKNYLKEDTEHRLSMKILFSIFRSRDCMSINVSR